MKNTLPLRLWRNFLETHSETIVEKRQEYLTKHITAAFFSLTFITTLAILSIYIAGFSDFATLITVATGLLIFTIGLFFISLGRWKFTAYATTILLASLSIYDTLYFGIGPSNIVEFSMVILISGFTLPRKFKWGIVILILGLYTSIGLYLLITKNFNVNWNEVFYWGVVVNLYIIALTGLIDFFSYQHQTALKLSLTKQAELQNEISRRKDIEEQLIQMTKEAQEAKKTQQEVFANMSHELRTPMNAVVGITNLLKNENLNATQTEYVNSLMTASENILNIINDILDLTMMGKGAMIFKNEPFELHDTISKIEKIMKTEASKKKINLKIIIQENIPTKLTGDSLRLTQILLNLLTNAIKFTKKGSVKLEVKKIKEENNIITLQFSVVDTGIGIPEKSRESIFESFKQYDITTKKEFEGTGIGLSIVKKLTKGMGGDIRLESETGKGSTFIVTLNFEISDKKVELEKIPKISTENLKGKNILLVEDNPVNQMVVKKMLENLKLNVFSVDNAREAIDKLKDSSFDLILMDIQLPEMDGITCTEFIRNKLHEDAPIVALTAHAHDHEKELAKKAGMNGYITKPFSPEDLIRSIATQLKNT